MRYESFGDMLVDVEQLASTEVRQTGNWSLGQILHHLSVALNSSIDGFDFSVPAPVRFVLNLLLKNRYLYKSVPAGFKVTGKFVPAEEATTADGLVEIRNAVQRQESVDARAAHPGFGRIIKDEWTNFHCPGYRCSRRSLTPATTRFATIRSCHEDEFITEFLLEEEIRFQKHSATDNHLMTNQLPTATINPAVKRLP